MSDVLFSSSGGLARITLNRPAALHALNTQMCADMIAALQQWRADESVKIVMIDHAEGTRGFCAGGDIRMLAESGAGDGRAAFEFFHAEYRLNHLLFSYEKPIVALMDGVTMGGGVGISMPAKYRVATERTAFAMPETGIGLFPDVGGGWYLPRLPSEIGMWLALTGARLKAADCMDIGIATHYAPSDKMHAIRALVEAAAEAEHPLYLLKQGLQEIDIDPGPAEALTPDNHARIDKLFRCGSVEALFADLAEEGSAWSLKQLETLRTKSPLSLRVSFRTLREGARAKSFAEEMAREYRVACRIVQSHDFREGVRALIVDKDNAPQWSPAALDGVTEAMVDAMFAPLPADQEWTPLS